MKTKRYKGVGAIAAANMPDFGNTKPSKDMTLEEALAWIERHIKRRAADHEMAKTSPEVAKALGLPFIGKMPDKGLSDGSCNRSACQLPLKGARQFIIRSMNAYYCESCAIMFNRDNLVRNEPPRCEEV